MATCFVIMPFGEWTDEYYRDIYQPAIKDAKLEAHRADDVFRPGTIIKDIWTYTKEAEVILADLSGKNSNVLYELGLAHAIAKPAVIVSDSLEDVPFDLRSLRVLRYNKNQPKWSEALRQDITRSLKELQESPLKSVLPAFLEAAPADPQNTVTESHKALLEIRQELEAIRQEAALRPPRPTGPTISTREIDDYVELLTRKDVGDDYIFEELESLGYNRILIGASIKRARYKGDIPF